jgi:hypothetical protein
LTGNDVTKSARSFARATPGIGAALLIAATVPGLAQSNALAK